ncbi:MAG: hypothetical protein KDB71_05375 [Mycobacterium sp.]|nr:hypothetical protein [Mycobacterium sp.]
MASTDRPGLGPGVMSGDGFYDRNSATQDDAAAFGLALVAEAISGMPLSPDRRVVVADLGCAQGRNSLAPMRAAVTGFRAAGATDIDVIHTDLPNNDWATLFAVIEHDPDTYLIDEGIHPFVVGRSFYDRLFTPSTLHLAWTASALHWLSSPPQPLSDHFFAQSSTDAVAREHYRSRSAADWERFLAHRSVELAPSGAVVFVDVCTDDQGSTGSQPLFECLQAALRGARDRGDLSDRDYAATVYPSWFRTFSEWRAPFTPTYRGPSGAVLELVSLTPTTMGDPFWPAYESNGNAEEYAASQTGFLKAFLEPSFRSAWALSPDDCDRVIKDVFADTAHSIAENPRNASPDHRLVTGLLRRIA